MTNWLPYTFTTALTVILTGIIFTFRVQAPKPTTLRLRGVVKDLQPTYHFNDHGNARIRGKTIEY
jgi:hypothetical protein